MERHWGTLPTYVVLPYLVGYLCLVLVLTGSPHIANGVFGVVFAMLFLGSSMRRWRNADLSQRGRLAVMAGAAGLGLVVAVLVGHVGLA